MRRATRISHAVAVIALGAIALGAVAGFARAESHTEDEELARWLPILGLTSVSTSTPRASTSADTAI